MEVNRFCFVFFCWPIVLLLCTMPWSSYYAKIYAGRIRPSLLITGLSRLAMYKTNSDACCHEAKFVLTHCKKATHKALTTARTILLANYS